MKEAKAYGFLKMNFDRDGNEKDSRGIISPLRFVIKANIR
jgi:hypothetical protein